MSVESKSIRRSYSNSSSLSKIWKLSFSQEAQPSKKPRKRDLTSCAKFSLNLKRSEPGRCVSWKTRSWQRIRCLSKSDSIAVFRKRSKSNVKLSRSFVRDINRRKVSVKPSLLTKIKSGSNSPIPSVSSKRSLTFFMR